MKAALALLVLTCVYAQSNSRNLYQACTDGGSSYYLSYDTSFNDYGAATLPSDQYYSFTNSSSGETVYFNLCAGTNICGGAMACVKDKFDVAITYVYPFYASQTICCGNIVWYGPEMFLSIVISCGEPGMTVNSFVADEYGLQIFVSSSVGCISSSAIQPYVDPVDYSSFTAPIYLKGRIAYFLQDYLGGYFESEFVGMFYYSGSYGLTINGTLSYEGESHFVSFIYQKQIPLNPPRAVSYIQSSATAPMACRIQGIDDNTDYEFADDIFSYYSNQWMTLQRNYTSVYFNPGETFPVNVYTPNRYQLQASLMTRVSDSKVVFLGYDLISPWFLYNGVGQYISEIDWNNIDSSPLGKNSFTPPSSWNC